MPRRRRVRAALLASIGRIRGQSSPEERNARAVPLSVCDSYQYGEGSTTSSRDRCICAQLLIRTLHVIRLPAWLVEKSGQARAALERHRRVLAVLCSLAFVAFAWSRATSQARLLEPRIFPDSIVYLQTAREPLQLEQLFYPKPITVPAVYHLLDADPARIAGLQLALMIVAWSLFGLTLCAVLRRPRARVAGLVLTLAFMLAPYRVGFTASVLSESIADSLAVLVIACGLLLSLATRMSPGRRRTVTCWAFTVLTFGVALAWIMARDTNAITALVTSALAAALWQLRTAGGCALGRRARRGDRGCEWLCDLDLPGRTSDADTAHAAPILFARVLAALRVPDREQHRVEDSARSRGEGLLRGAWAAASG